MEGGDDEDTPTQGVVRRPASAESRAVANLAMVVHSVATRLAELGRDLDRAKGSERTAILDGIESALSRAGDVCHDSRRTIHLTRRGVSVPVAPQQLPSLPRKSESMVLQWIFRIAGYALTAIAAPFVTQKYGAEAGAAVGGVGGILLHKASPTVVPKKAGQ